METSKNYERITDFKITIDDFNAGWETITLKFNDNLISFIASYIGQEPLSTLIDAVRILDEEECSGCNFSRCYVHWASEPGQMDIALKHDLITNQLIIEIENDCSITQSNFVMNYDLFRKAVIEIVITTLNKYGICGFNYIWDVDNDVLPIGSLLSILGVKINFDNDTQRVKSSLAEEIAVLKSIMSYK